MARRRAASAGDNRLRHVPLAESSGSHQDCTCGRGSCAVRPIVGALVVACLFFVLVPSALAQGITGFSPSDGQTISTPTPTFTISTSGFDPTSANDNLWVGVSTSFQVGPDGTLANTFGCLFEATPTSPTSSTYVAAMTPTSWTNCPLQAGSTYYWQIWFFTADTSSVDQSLLTCSGVTCHTKVMTLTVAALPADFSLQVSPGSAAVTAPSSTSFVVSAQAINGFNSQIKLTVAGLPADARASWALVSDGDALTVTVGAATPSGDYTLTITGSGGGVTHTVTTILTVTSPPPPTTGTGGRRPSVGAAHDVTYAPYLPSSAHFRGASVKQTRLGRAAYGLSKELGIPKAIDVACWSVKDWAHFSDENPESQYSLLGFHLLSMPHWVHLSPAICRTLETLTYHRPRYANVITANALDTLTHEMIHALGVRNEARTECDAMQLSFVTGWKLGIPLAYAENLDHLSLRNYHSHPPRYIDTRDCRENGAWDLFPNRPSLPWHRPNL